MTRWKRRAQVTSLSVLFWLLAMTAACASPPAPVPTPTPTTRAVIPTSTPHPGVQQLSINAPGTLLPSPDGTLLASVDGAHGIVRLYDLDGHVQAQDSVSADVAWLPDSSGILLWGRGVNSLSCGPLLIMDRHGSVQSVGVSACDPIVSPDGAWIAATQYGGTIQQNQALIVPRAGGPARVLAQGADVLGWQGGRVIYWMGGSVYAVSPTGSRATQLAQVPGGDYLRPLIDLLPAFVVEPATSPDGQALVAFGNRGALWIIAGARILQPPPGAFEATTLYWAGPHDILGSQGNQDLTILDVLTGAIVRDAGVQITCSIEATAGSWIACASTSPSSTFLTVINYDTQQTLDVGMFPTGTVALALGQNRFLIHHNGGAGETYILDPAVFAGA